MTQTMPQLISARTADLGGGLMVKRLLPSAQRRMVGPFIFLDHAGPVKPPPGQSRPADVRPHPHIGLSTVSYLLSGIVTHRDSLGVTQLIRPGEVNWMTAGRGITHSERFDHPDAFAGDGLELLQAWVALPEADEECAPSFRNHPAGELPLIEDHGLWLRLIAGEAFGVISPVRTHSPLFYAHVELERGAQIELPGGYGERAVYAVRGRIESAADIHEAGRLLVFPPGGKPVVKAAEASTLMLLGGDPVGERHIWWNFVSSSRERIEQARADWKAGRIRLPPHDNGEFIPLPE